DIVRAFGEHASITQARYQFADVIAVDQLGIAEYPRRLSEKMLDESAVFFDLTAEFSLIVKGGKRVVVSLSQEFNTARGGQLLEGLQRFRGIFLHLLDGNAGHGKRDAKFSAVLLDQFQQQSIGWQVTLLRNLLENHTVAVIVEVIVLFADVEERIATQPHRL